MDNLFAGNEKQLEFWILFFRFLRYCLLRVRSVHLYTYSHYLQWLQQMQMLLFPNNLVDLVFIFFSL